MVALGTLLLVDFHTARIATSDNASLIASRLAKARQILAQPPDLLECVATAAVSSCMLEMSRATPAGLGARSSTGAVLGRSGGSKPRPTRRSSSSRWAAAGPRLSAPLKCRTTACLEGGPTTDGAGAGLSSCRRNDSSDGGSAPGGGGGGRGVVGGVGVLGGAAEAGPAPAEAQARRLRHGHGCVGQALLAGRRAPHAPSATWRCRCSR